MLYQVRMKATLGNLSIKRLSKNRAILILPFWNKVKAVQVQELSFLKIYMKVFNSAKNIATSLVKSSQLRLHLAILWVGLV